jgi:hypothetical protein
MKEQNFLRKTFETKRWFVESSAPRQITCQRVRVQMDGSVVGDRAEVVGLAVVARGLESI